MHQKLDAMIIVLCCKRFLIPAVGASAYVAGETNSSVTAESSWRTDDSLTTRTFEGME